MTRQPFALTRLRLRLAWLQVRITMGCWLTGTTREALRRELRRRASQLPRRERRSQAAVVAVDVRRIG